MGLVAFLLIGQFDRFADMVVESSEHRGITEQVDPPPAGGPSSAVDAEPAQAAQPDIIEEEGMEIECGCCYMDYPPSKVCVHPPWSPVHHSVSHHTSAVSSHRPNDHAEHR